MSHLSRRGFIRHIGAAFAGVKIELPPGRLCPLEIARRPNKPAPSK